MRLRYCRVFCIGRLTGGLRDRLLLKEDAMRKTLTLVLSLDVVLVMVLSACGPAPTATPVPTATTAEWVPFRAATILATSGASPGSPKSRLPSRW